MSFQWTEIYAGDELRFTYENSLYPTSDWTFNANFIGLVTGSVTGSTLDSTTFQVTASSALTSTFSNGSYIVYFSVTRGTERHIVEKNSINVILNPATIPVYGFDPRSHAQRVYDSICSVIEGRATEKELSIAIGGRSLQKTPLKDLLSIKNTYAEMLRDEKQAERVAKGEDAGKNILVRFV